MLCMVLFVLATPAFAGANGNLGQNADLCGKCHQHEANIIRGVLKGVSLSEHTMNLDLGSHMETVAFSSETVTRNMASVKELERYRGAGLRVFFTDNGKQRQALQITRLNPETLISPENRIDAKGMEGLPRQAALIDIRPAAAFAAGHIDGAMNIPAASLKESNPLLPFDHARTLVIYGSGAGDDAEVAGAALMLMAQGYGKVKIYGGGFADWDNRHVSACAMPYALAQQAGGAFFIHLWQDHAMGRRTAELPRDLNLSLAALESSSLNLPAGRDTLIIVYGAGHDQAAAMIREMGYHRVRVIANEQLPWAERLAANSSEDCF